MIVSRGLRGRGRPPAIIHLASAIARLRPSPRQRDYDADCPDRSRHKPRPPRVQLRHRMRRARDKFARTSPPDAFLEARDPAQWISDSFALAKPVGFRAAASKFRLRSNFTAPPRARRSPRYSLQRHLDLPMLLVVALDREHIVRRALPSRREGDCHRARGARLNHKRTLIDRERRLMPRPAYRHVQRTRSRIANYHMPLHG